MEKSATTQKKGSAGASKTTAPTNTPPRSKNDSTSINQNNENERSDKNDFENDEREWQDPDIKPKYPTDVQAKSADEKSQVNTRPSVDESADYNVENQDEDDALLESENPGLLNHH